MPDDGIKLLQERCGFLLENGQKDFCCDAQQVDLIIFNKSNNTCMNIIFQIGILNKNIKLASAILDRCPACMTNLAKHICDFTCSPEQAKYAKVIETQINEKGIIFHKLIEENLIY